VDSNATDDQRVLLDASVRFIQQTCPLARVRERAYRNILQTQGRNVADWSPAREGQQAGIAAQQACQPFTPQ